MSYQSKQKDKIFRSVPKTIYLQEILARLETEYIQILNLVTEHNLTHERGIGFWSLVRVIFPVIESVASIMGKDKEDFLQEDLGVPYGHLVWELYRHALMHSDELRFAVYKGKTFAWAIHLGNEDAGHIVENQFGDKPTTIHISIPSLYFSLHEYLKKEAKKMIKD